MQGAFPVNDPLAVKIWAKQVEVAERDYADLAPLIGTGPDAVIQERQELAKGPGDEIKVTLRAVLQGPGFSEGDTPEGSGEVLTWSQDSLVINLLGNTVVSPSDNTIDAQRVPVKLRAEGRDALAEWYANRKSTSVFNQLCGYTPANTVSLTSGPKWTGLNPVTAPTSGAGLIRHMWAGTATSDETLTSADTFTTLLIEKAVTRAKLGHQKIKPIMVGGRKKYVMYLHEVQVEQLRTDTGAGGWLEIQKAALAGAGKHGIYTNALGEWRDVVLRSTQDITNGVNSSTGAPITNVKRAVLLGRQAAICGYGRKTNPARGQYRYSEELKQHGLVLEMGIWGIWGCKKSVYSTPNLSTGAMEDVDFGSFVVSTWAPKPT